MRPFHLKYCDLHIHSNASDGTFTPAQIVERAWNFRLRGIALTDHDTVSAIAETEVLCAERGLGYIPAIEISTSTLDGRMHILGYFIDRNNTRLLELIGKMADSRNNRIARMCERLNEIGVPCDIDEVRRIADGASIGRPHLAEHMVNRGVVKDVREAFRYYLAEGGKVYILKSSPSPEEAIGIIHGAGGIAIAAHPGVTGGMMEALPKLVEMGIDGFEAYYPGHDHETTSTILKLAKDTDLLVTGGSDCHGLRRGDPLLGVFKVKFEVFERLTEAWAIKRRG